MEQIVRQVLKLLEQGIIAIFKFLELVWTWSFGQIISIFQSDWQSLPIWKLVILAAVLIAIAYVIYKVALHIWGAVQSVFHAFVALLTAFVAVLPQIVVAGLLAFAGGWVIQNVNL